MTIIISDDWWSWFCSAKHDDNVVFAFGQVRQSLETSLVSQTMLLVEEGAHPHRHHHFQGDYDDDDDDDDDDDRTQL